MKTVTLGACMVCGTFCDWIPTHVKLAHGMTMDEYLQLHPESNTQRPFTIDIVPPTTPLRIAEDAHQYEAKQRIRGIRR